MSYPMNRSVLLGIRLRQCRNSLRASRVYNVLDRYHVEIVYLKRPSILHLVVRRLAVPGRFVCQIALGSVIAWRRTVWSGISALNPNQMRRNC